MKYIVVIPARMASTRLPGKPLLDIEGKSMIRRTYEQVCKAVIPDLVYVATDSDLILEECHKYGINTIMTSVDCKTGTDRLAEVSNKIKADYYINVQGDEPLMDPSDITKIIDAIKQYPNKIINGYAPIETREQYLSRSIPKVVYSINGDLLYLSRSPIPGNKNAEFNVSWRQICVYAFTKESLLAFSSVENKTPLEEEEDLEILRFLELGYSVQMIQLSANSVAVDTPSDIKKVRQILKNRND